MTATMPTQECEQFTPFANEVWYASGTAAGHLSIEFATHTQPQPRWFCWLPRVHHQFPSWHATCNPKSEPEGHSNVRTGYEHQ